MDEEWKQTIRDFQRVWPRVSGKQGPPPGHGRRPAPKTPAPPQRPSGDEKELEKFIRAETGAEREYLSLASRTRGRAAQELRRLAAGSQRLTKRLQAEYYLLTGDTCPLPPPSPRTCGVHEGLRQVWMDAREAEKAYLEAAGRTRDDRLSALYGEAAEEKQRQRKALYALARRMFA